MNKIELLTKVNTKINKLKMQGRKYSPEILLVLGIAGVVTGTVLACVATTKIPDVKAKKDEDLADMHERLDTPDPMTEEQSHAIKKETTAIYFKTGAKYAMLYAPSFLVTGLSVSCLVASNVILRRRLIGVSAAYAAISQSFKEYRGRVAERYGEEIEKEIRYNIKPKEITTITTDSKGKEKQKTEKIKVADPSEYSDFARIYDDGNIGWSKDPMANLHFLKCQQTSATQRLKSQGFLFINDVYEMLGFSKTREGQVAGWIYDEKNPVGDNFVDFGIYDITRERARDFVNGYERSIVLDFNIDGNILDMI
jgi:hypothetical protein